MNSNKKTDNDLATTIILIFVFMIVAFGLFSFWFGKPKECNWVSDKGVVFKDEQQVKDLINNLDKQPPLMSFGRDGIEGSTNLYEDFDKNNERMIYAINSSALAYSYSFEQDNITYSDTIRKVC